MLRVHFAKPHVLLRTVTLVIVIRVPYYNSWAGLKFGDREALQSSHRSAAGPPVQDWNGSQVILISRENLRINEDAQFSVKDSKEPTDLAAYSWFANHLVPITIDSVAVSVIFSANDV